MITVIYFSYRRDKLIQVFSRRTADHREWWKFCRNIETLRKVVIMRKLQ